ncbi:Uncharacterized protein SCF082_LOCUS15467 [Durusdinium trenchii]|uniref:Uncharacterized protein n=1 Tax=Durusdinium trenchii TaxID=1381693 RepID=A0ABP0K606_9DINO
MNGRRVVLAEPEEFIKHVTQEVESRQSVKMRIKGQWATEDKMRDVLKLKEWDKYESKLAFWFEEDVEAEWETSKTQTRREQTEFGVETTAGDALGEEPSNPTFEMADIRGATAGWGGSSSNGGGGPPPQELKAKYDAIPEDQRTNTHNAFIEKLRVSGESMELKQNKINDIYSSGAVEGYSEEQERQLMVCYKEAMKLPMPQVFFTRGASAARLRRFAHSAILEANDQGSNHISAAIRKAGRMTVENLKNSERDLHRLFEEEQLSIPVKLSIFRVGLLQVHHIKLKTWFEFLLHDYPQVVLGGFEKDDPRSKLLLEAFWSTFRIAHSDHWVYDYHSDSLNKCVPYYLHLDEGTGLRKRAVLIYNMQPLFGAETKNNFEELFSSTSDRSDLEMQRVMLKSQAHNQRGSPFMSRFLLTILPKRWYTKGFARVYDDILNLLASESRSLSEDGAADFFPICLGIKGDAPALAKAAHANRSFMSLS